MAIRQFFPGTTNSLFFEFFDPRHERTSVEDLTVNLYTPERQLYSTSSVATFDSEDSKYQFDFFIPTSLTVGNWYGTAVGISQGIAIIADPRPFEIVNQVSDHNWLSVQDLRDYIGEDEESQDDHSDDSLYKMVLKSSMDLVSSHIHDTIGIFSFSETWQIHSSDRRMLKKYPIIQITGLTVTDVSYTPRTAATPNVETNAGETTPFYFRLLNDVGTMIYTDIDGIECQYSNCLVSIDYKYGFSSIPEPIRLATLMLSSKLLNICQEEGIDNLRIADANFSIDRNLFSGEVGDLLKPYRKIGIMWDKG